MVFPISIGNFKKSVKEVIIFIYSYRSSGPQPSVVGGSNYAPTYLLRNAGFRNICMELWMGVPLVLLDGSENRINCQSRFRDVYEIGQICAKIFKNLCQQASKKTKKRKNSLILFFQLQKFYLVTKVRLAL